MVACAYDVEISTTRRSRVEANAGPAIRPIRQVFAVSLYRTGAVEST